MPATRPCRTTSPAASGSTSPSGPRPRSRPKSIQRAARREYLALQGISHDGIVRAEQYSDELLAGPAVVFRHGKDWQRLDHFMAARRGDLPLETRLEMIRQLAEALDHAHRRHLYHRALAPRSVYVELDGRYPRLRIADWQVAARPHGTGTHAGRRRRLARGQATSALLRHVERSAGPYLAPEFQTPDAPPRCSTCSASARSAT